MMFARRAYRRHLPHFQTEYRAYFVTFVTKNRKVLPEKARSVVLGELLVFAPSLHVAVVMPEHVHAIVSPPDMALEDMIRLIKGRSARNVNLLLGRSGTLWQSESFDHELRRAESLEQKIEYVRQNAVRRGLSTTPDEYPWLWPRYETT
ncbi:MAG TPA: transposase [Thermoanaerobaculia bacterium]|jgi:REP element-mobilizing transposase RayT|nr:transposase [Thermoanaerobaculia bacterium]